MVRELWHIAALPVALAALVATFALRDPGASDAAVTSALPTAVAGATATNEESGRVVRDKPHARRVARATPARELVARVAAGRSVAV
ncbi:MAG: hypothetical protein M3229_03415, partial [Actinomycetota bacterium]|nr:hypothetical protein [Actinomycetota bacterium]